MTDIIEAGDHRCFANVLQKQGNALLASQHLKECIEIRTRVLGNENNNTIIDMSSLASSYRGLGRHQVAVELWEKVLGVRRRLGATITLTPFMSWAMSQYHIVT